VIIFVYRGIKMKYVIYKKKERIGVLTLSRPEALNALNNEMFAEIRGVLRKIKKDKDVYSVIVTGEGDKSFVAGADIAEMKDQNQKQGYDLACLEVTYSKK